MYWFMDPLPFLISSKFPQLYSHFSKYSPILVKFLPSQNIPRNRKLQFKYKIGSFEL